MVRLAPRFWVLAVLVWASAVPAHADPIQVTGGSAFVYWDGSGSSATLLGTGLNVATDTYGGAFGGILVPGVTRFDGGLTFGSVGSAPHEWSVQVDGASYSAFISGNLDFDTEEVLIPPVASPDTWVTFSTPFTMTGRIRGTTGALGTGSVLFDVLVSGGGMASTQALGSTANLYRTGGVKYEFSDVAPTPEPGTLLLVGTALAGLAARRRRLSSPDRA